MNQEINQLEKICGIPYFLKDVTFFASEAFFLYTQLIKNYTAQADNLRKLKAELPSREKALEDIKNAITYNLHTLKEIQNILLPYVDPKIIAGFRPNPNDDLSGYLKDFLYLKRDWSWDSDSEKQLKIINKTLLRSTEQLTECDTALFLGGGVGRIAFDLAPLFTKVFITDKSFSMAYHYQKLISEDIEFYEINFKNILHSTDAVSKLRATINPEHLNRQETKKRFDKIDYFISDVRQLPFADKSISAIYSVYFSDIVALKLWLPEIKRVLKEDGLFVHYGPLDYFFSDPSEMLAANEVKAVFDKNGFQNTIDEFVDSVHLPNSKALVNKLYRNWFLVCRKKHEEAQTIQIHKDAVLQLINTVKYSINAVIDSTGCSETYELIMSTGEIFEGAQDVIEIIKLVDGKSTISAIVYKLDQKYGTLAEKDLQSIYRVIQMLVDKKMIKVVK